MLKRTQKEIVKRIKERAKQDAFGFEVDEYIPFLEYEYAKEFLKDGISKEEWEQDGIPFKDPVKMIKDYMPFAWKKANDKRGISAWRSLQHMVAWLWLAGEDEFLKEHNEFQDYEFYGKPQLIAICKKYNIDWKQYDDGVRQN